MRSPEHWRPAAAYLYTLHLDGPQLAWEYLRRNAEYRRDWQRCAPVAAVAQRWGLRGLVDPALDARDAEPTWLTDPDDLTHLIGDSDAPVPHGFDLWNSPGTKQLIHDGSRLLLVSAFGHQKMRFTLDASVCHGKAVAYRVRPDDRAPLQYHAIERQRRLWKAVQEPQTTRARPDRMAVMHMRCLQLCDGVEAGASQRSIADALFGDELVAARWDSDGDLRNQIRNLLRRARAYLKGGYLQLLSQLAPPA